MARIHILDSPERGKWNSVVHFTVPAGSNEVGIAWKTILLEHYPNAEPRAFSSPEERDAIIAGDIVEIDMTVLVEPAELTGAELQAALESMAAHRIAQWLHEPQRRYQYWGYSQGEVS